MSVENKEISWNNLPDIKKLLENKDIDWALSGLWEFSKRTIENKQEELAWCYEIAEFTRNLNQSDSYVEWVNNILSQFLTPQSLIV